MIFSADGHIGTNNHVVADAERVTVTLQDGREFIAQVIGRDPPTDVALVKIDATGLRAVTFAESSQASC